MQEMSARAVEYTNIPVCLTHCALGFRLEQFKQFDVAHILNHFLLDFVVDLVEELCRSG